MKKYGWKIWLGVALILLSAAVYYIHYLIFRDPHHIFIYLIGDIAFVFFEVLLVTLILHRILEMSEKKARLEKLNMVIGAFFSEVGTRLLTILSSADRDTQKFQEDAKIEDLDPKDSFQKARQRLATIDCRVDEGAVDWENLKSFLAGKRDFMLRLLENPNLLEHESFTDMLWAVFHLTEELGARGELRGLPKEDYGHLRGDVDRAYGRLVREWLQYMQHLQDNYPYLFSLSLRTNPFNAEASPVVQ